MAVEEAGLPVGGASSVRSPGYVRRYAGLALVALCGPGLIVMLADTDAGSVITAPSPVRNGATG